MALKPVWGRGNDSLGCENWWECGGGDGVVLLSGGTGVVVRRDEGHAFLNGTGVLVRQDRGHTAGFVVRNEGCTVKSLAMAENC